MTRPHTPLEAPVPPRPEGGRTRTGGMALQTVKLLLQSCFFLQPPKWPVRGRKPKPDRGSVGSLPQFPIHLLNNPPHSRHLCRSEPWEC